jgi:outer membrane protein OmpA-like peptidoglycan-associated protein
MTRKRRSNWLPAVLVGLLAIGGAVVWLAPIPWPFSISLPDILSGSGETAGTPPPESKITVSKTTESKTSVAAPAAPKSTPPVTEEVLKRRMAAADEQLASASTQMQSDKRTIDGLQSRLTDGERQAKALQQRIDTLEKELTDLRNTPREARPTTAAAPAQREPQQTTQAPPPPAERSSERPAERPAQAAPPLPPPAPIQAIRPQAAPQALPQAAPRTPPAPQAIAASGARTGSCAGIAARFPRPVVLSFGRNQGVLRADHEKQLSDVAAAVAPCRDVGLLIRGFTDSRGSDQRNAELSRLRADLSARYVEGRGISRERLTVAGFASASPVTTNDTETGRARNRRVELTVQPLR